MKRNFLNTLKRSKTEKHEPVVLTKNEIITMQKEGSANPPRKQSIQRSRARNCMEEIRDSQQSKVHVRNYQHPIRIRNLHRL